MALLEPGDNQQTAEKRKICGGCSAPEDLYTITSSLWIQKTHAVGMYRFENKLKFGDDI